LLLILSFSLDKKSLKKNRIMEELKKLKLDKKSIGKIILNYSLEDIEEKCNQSGRLVAAL